MKTNFVCQSSLVPERISRVLPLTSAIILASLSGVAAAATPVYQSQAFAVPDVSALLQSSGHAKGPGLKAGLPQKLPKNAQGVAAFSSDSVAHQITQFMQSKAPAPQAEAPGGFTLDQQQVIKAIAQGVGQKNFSVKFRADNLTPSFIGGLEGYRSSAGLQRGLVAPGPKEIAADVMEDMKGLFKLQNPEEELGDSKLSTDDLGFSHVRYQQKLNGVPVFGRELRVHLNAKNQVYAVNGHVEPSRSMPAPIANLDAAAALEVVRQHLQLSQPLEAGQILQQPELVYYPTGKNMTLVYVAKVLPSNDSSWQYFVDANTGAVVHRINLITNAVVDAKGVDALGKMQTFKAWEEGGAYFLANPDLPSNQPAYTSINNGPSAKGDLFVLDAQSTDQPKIYVQSQTNQKDAGWDPIAVSAMVNTVKVYNYYLNTFNRNSYDGNEGNLYAIVHVGQHMANAYWNGKTMNYGDGDGQTFGPLAKCFDVAAHEMTHGVVQTTANLIYENQSGAMNESFADVFASMMDRANWTLGEDCTVASPGYLRNIKDPHLGVGGQPKHMSEYRNLPNTPDMDNGGVHINSGIPNRAAYLIIEGLTAEGQGQSIGFEKAEKLYYRALTQYLTATSQFSDLRQALVASAKDLFGEGSAEQQAVKKAFDLVGIVDASGGGNGGGSQPTPADPVSGDEYMAYLYPEDESDDNPGSEDYQLYAYHFQGSFSGYQEAQDLKIDDNAKFTRPAMATFDGQPAIFYVDTNDNIQLYDYATQSVSSVTDSNNVGTIALSPDKHYFAFTTNTQDDKILVVDLNGDSTNEFTIPPLSYQQNVDNTTNVEYVDSITFNYKGSLIAFDALNCISLPEDRCEDGGGQRFWSIGILNINTGVVTYPFVSQSPMVDIGFPSFANTNDTIMAFDMIDRTNGDDVSQTLIADFNQGTLTVAWDHGAGWNASVPSFWGDDAHLTFVGKTNDSREHSTFRIPLANYLPAGNSREELNSFAATMPVMHRSGERNLATGIQVDSNLVDFGERPLNDNEAMTVTLHNNNAFDIRITNIETSGEFTHNGINQTIPRGTQYSFQVSLANPSQAGNYTGNLKVQTETNQELNIALNAKVGTNSGGNPGGGNGGGGNQLGGGGGGGGGAFGLPELGMGLGLLLGGWLRRRAGKKAG